MVKTSNCRFCSEVISFVGETHSTELENFFLDHETKYPRFFRRKKQNTIVFVIYIMACISTFTRNFGVQPRFLSFLGISQSFGSAKKFRAT
eukprot:UN02241